FLVGLGLDVHRLGFGFTLLEDDLGFGFALRADGGGAALGFHHQARFLGTGESFDAAPLVLGGLQHGRGELGLAALDFGLLHQYLVFLFHLVNDDLFGADLLLHDVGLDLIGFIRLRLLALHAFQILGLLDFEIALRFGLLGLRQRLGDHTL